jgi:polysaccharide biosynthesis transport protein
MAKPMLDNAQDPRGVNRERQTHAGSFAGAGESEAHLLDYVRILYKRRRVALTAFVIVMMAAAVYTFTTTPVYEARSRLLIESDNPNVVSFAEVINEEQAKADYYQTQYNILQSRALARRTIENLKLWDKAPFNAAAGESGSTLAVLARAGGAIAAATSGTAAGSEHALAERGVASFDETARESGAIDVFLANLSVSPIRNSRLVDLKYRLPDPEMAAVITNALAKSYIEQNLEYKFLASKEASDWLGERLAEQRKYVELAEAKLQQYREQNDAISLEDRENIVVQKLTDLNSAVTQAKTERFQKEALYRQLQSLGRDSRALDSFPAILANSFIQQQKAELARLQSQYAQMAEKLGDRHPEMVKLRSAIEMTEVRLDGEIGKVVDSVNNEFQAAVAKEESLTAALNSQKNEALAMNRKAIEYSVLERDVQSNKQLYESLLQRAKETGISSELKTSNIRVVDHAERPSNPVVPNTLLNLVAAIFGGGLFAGVLAFFFEYMDNRIKSPDEIRTHLGLPCLGLLPAVAAAKGEAGYPLVNSGVPLNFTEAMRAIRTNVLFSASTPGAQTLVVTSTGPGEGKSIVAANLAMSLAHADSRVLLIDADMRKPKAHELFSMPQEPGLSNLLVGQVKANETVRSTPVAGLWVLPAGRTPPNPAELLGSKRLRDFLGTLNERFDWVVIDSPPVMAVTDATVIAHTASGVLFVVGAEMTNRHNANRALDQLQQAQARFVGAVLNRVDLDQNPYYYSHYYRREYASYYQSPGQR